MGTLIGVEENKLIVKFDNISTGENARAFYPAISRKYPGGTAIGRTEIEYSLSRNKSLISSTAKLVQFPVITAHAVTG